MPSLAHLYLHLALLFCYSPSSVPLIVISLLFLFCPIFFLHHVAYSYSLRLPIYAFSASPRTLFFFLSFRLLSRFIPSLRASGLYDWISNLVASSSCFLLFSYFFPYSDVFHFLSLCFPHLCCVLRISIAQIFSATCLFPTFVYTSLSMYLIHRTFTHIPFSFRPNSFRLQDFFFFS